MDSKNKYEPVDFTVGKKSEDRRVNFETPSNTPPRYVNEQVFYYTPFNSPVKMHSSSENYDLGLCPSPVFSSDSETEDKKNNCQQNIFVSVSPASAKTCSSDCENGLRSEENKFQPSTKKSYSYFLGFGKGKSKTDDSKTGESYPDIEVPFHLNEETENPIGSDDVLKQFTLSPEFLYLKNSLACDDKNFPSKQEDRLQTELKNAATAETRKTSLTYPNSKKEFSFGRKLSLNDLVKTNYDFELSDKSLTGNLRETKNNVLPIREIGENPPSNDVSFKNSLNPEVPAWEMEDPTSLSNLNIVEQSPSIRYGSNFECSLPYDFSKLKKPSTRLGDLLEYCKKDSKSKGSEKSVNRNNAAVLSNNQESKKNLDIFTRSMEKDVNRKGINFTSPKTKYGNLNCCLRPYPDSEIFSDLKESPSRKAVEDFSVLDKKIAKCKPRCDSESGSKDRKSDCNFMDLLRAEETYDTRNSRRKDAHTSRRADQSYCELIKQQHEEMKKDRAKRSRKKVERICRSDPPDKLAVGDKPCESLSDYDKNSKKNNVSDLNNVLKKINGKSKCEDKVCDMCSGKIQRKPKIDRTESLYDNKTSLGRIHSCYENQKKWNEEDSVNNRCNRLEPQAENLPSFSKVQTSHPKSDITMVHGSWWPVVEQPGFEWWMQSWEDNPKVGKIVVQMEDIIVASRLEQTLPSLSCPDRFRAS